MNWRLQETGQVVGFISPITEHFCHRCNRLRLQADGHLRTCLSRDDTPSLRDLLRGGMDDAELQEAIRGIQGTSEAKHRAPELFMQVLATYKMDVYNKKRVEGH